MYSTSASCLCMYMYMYEVELYQLLWALSIDSGLSVGAGEKLTDDEVDALLTGVEDSQGQVNYEGWSMVHSCNIQFVGPDLPTFWCILEQ